jgi:hypothetical protein
MSASRLRILVSGMMAGVPFQGGATWAVLQYVLGLRRLGHDVRFVEPIPGDGDFPSDVARYFRGVVERLGLAGEAALLRPGRRETLGLSYPALRRFAQDADLVLNLSGLLREPELMEAADLRVYVDLDPAFTQLWAEVAGIDMGFDGHDRFVTVGLELGREGCPIPTCGRTWIPTLQPVVLDEWPRGEAIRHDALTTVANWRGYGSVEYQGVFHGQKAHSLRGLLRLPERTSQRFLLALAIAEGDARDRRALETAGWELVTPALVASTPDRYREFVQGSRGEFGFAKTGYVESRSGWFSDRSACYLAAGRPVLAQETGFSRHLPTGEGLIAFSDEEEALAGVESLRSRYARHSRRARDLAVAHFHSDRVLTRLLDAVLEGAPPSQGPVTDGRTSPASDTEADLQRALQEILGRTDGDSSGIRSLSRRPYPYRTSFALEEVEVELDDGTGLQLLLKDLGPDALVGEARRAKPGFLASPGREGTVYRTLLAPRGFGPVLHGTVDDPDKGRHWLFLERVTGLELYQVGELETWREVARWLACFHGAYRGDPLVEQLAEEGAILRYGASLLETWLARIRSFAGEGFGANGPAPDLLERLERVHPYVVRRLLRTRPTLIHGDFYASNVLVREGEEGVEVVPVDWEMAGVGPGVLDLAALIAGGWSEEAKIDLALTYRQALESSVGDDVEPPEAFLRTVACSRLQLAIQWMGWARDWDPPAEHVQDWAGEARTALALLEA